MTYIHPLLSLPPSVRLDKFALPHPVNKREALVFGELVRVHILVSIPKINEDLTQPHPIPSCCSCLKIGQSCNSSSKNRQRPRILYYIFAAHIFQEYKRIGKELTCLEVILSSSLEKIGIFCLINGLKPLVPMGYIFKVNTGVALQNFNFFWANRGPLRAKEGLTEPSTSISHVTFVIFHLWVGIDYQHQGMSGVLTT